MKNILNNNKTLIAMTKKYYQQPKLKVVILEEDDLVTSSPDIYTGREDFVKQYHVKGIFVDQGVVRGDDDISF